MAKIILVIFTAVLAAAVNADIDQGGCTCAVFPDNSSIPIIEQPLQYNVSCDKEGAEICQHLCVALAQGAKDKAPAMICEKLGTHVENLKVGVFTKSCDNRDEWSFTGLNSPEPICCHEGKETLCDSKTDTSSLSSDTLQGQLE